MKCTKCGSEHTTPKRFSAVHPVTGQLITLTRYTCNNRTCMHRWTG